VRDAWEGKRPLRNGLFIYTPDRFKRDFKVGDLVMGYSTKKVGRITAIGSVRFLYEVTFGGHPREQVATMKAGTGWAPVEKERKS
jgi:hypothetical protein